MKKKLLSVLTALVLVTSCLSKKYDDLKRGVTYRIQVVSKDYISGNSHTTTAYTRSF